MKRNYYALMLACVLCPAIISAQNLDKLQDFAKPPTLNSSGDPISNVVDPNGAKQGLWSFEQTNGSVFFKIEFTDNLPGQFELFSGSNVFASAESEFIDLGVTNLYADILSDLSQTGINLSNKGFFLVVSPVSDYLIFYGDWTAPETQSAQDIVQTYNLKPLLQLTNYNYAILDF